MHEWEAKCHVCGSQWTCETSDDDNPGPTFCEECRERGLLAPGVLNWKEIKCTATS